MITLSFGYKKPQTNDRGPQVFPALEENWERVNNHDHNGVNSKKLSTSAIESVSIDILSAAWVATTDGMYKQTINAPAGMSLAKSSLEFRRASGNIVYPTVVIISDFQFEVHVNDNTLVMKVLVG